MLSSSLKAFFLNIILAAYAAAQISRKRGMRNISDPEMKIKNALVPRTASIDELIFITEENSLNLLKPFVIFCIREYRDAADIRESIYLKYELAVKATEKDETSSKSFLSRLFSFFDSFFESFEEE
jgi:hypothetical protein